MCPKPHYDNFSGFFFQSTCPSSPSSVTLSHRFIINSQFSVVKFSSVAFAVYLDKNDILRLRHNLTHRRHHHRDCSRRRQTLLQDGNGWYSNCLTLAWLPHVKSHGMCSITPGQANSRPSGITKCCLCLEILGVPRSETDIQTNDCISCCNRSRSQLARAIKYGSLSRMSFYQIIGPPDSPNGEFLS